VTPFVVVLLAVVAVVVAFGVFSARRLASLIRVASVRASATDEEEES